MKNHQNQGAKTEINLTSVFQYDDKVMIFVCVSICSSDNTISTWYNQPNNRLYRQICVGDVVCEHS
jgi:hypothetical protein